MVEERLHELAVEVARLRSHFTSELGSEHARGNVQRQMTELSGEVKAIRKLLSGNGEIGIVTRLDRLEQSARSRKVVFCAVVVSVIGIFSKAAFDLLIWWNAHG